MNLYDVLAGQGTTHFERLFARYVGGGNVQTITGIPPISFKSDGTPLTAWSITGNMAQTGTPTSDNPIWPQETGERMAQLFDYQTMANGTIGYYLKENGSETSNSSWAITDYIPCDGVEFTVAALGGQSPAICLYDENKQYITGKKYNTVSSREKTAITITSNQTAKFIRFSWCRASDASYDNPENIMLNSGSTALPYEPFGYKIPITCAGQTVPVYLGQTPTTRRIKKLVLTGEETTWRLTGSGRIAVRIGTLVSIPDNASCFSTHFVGTSATSFANIGDGECSAQLSGSGGYREIGFYSTTYSTLEAFKQFVSDQYAAGTPVTVWYVLATPETAIVNEPLCKIGDYADELSSTDAAVTIPTAKGSNVLTVETDLQPSEMTITYKG